MVKKQKVKGSTPEHSDFLFRAACVTDWKIIFHITYSPGLIFTITSPDFDKVVSYLFSSAVESGRVKWSGS